MGERTLWPCLVMGTRSSAEPVSMWDLKTGTASSAVKAFPLTTAFQRLLKDRDDHGVDTIFVVDWLPHVVLWGPARGPARL